MNPETRGILMGLSVATLATAVFKHGLCDEVIQGVHPVGWIGKNMVGPACTLRYMPAREDRNQPTEFRNPEHPRRDRDRTGRQRSGDGQPQAGQCRFFG